MTALIEQPILRQDTEGVHNLWHSIKVCLQDYIGQDSLNSRYAKTVGQSSCQSFVNEVQKLPNYRELFRNMQSVHRYEAPWHRRRIAADPTMEAELVTVFGESPTPIHSYDGPVGIVYVVDGELTLTRYTEISNAIGRCSAITNLNCLRVNRYSLADASLVDSLSTPIVEMQANTERCIFFNVHLRDHSDHPHYFYYPSYLPPHGRNSGNTCFFANRIPSEW